MNKVKKILSIIGLAIIPVMYIFVSWLLINTENVPEEVTADGFTIEGYHVNLDVKKDNKVYVTETITVNFTADNKHGIYKFTPLWLKYTGKDNKTIKRKSKVKDYRALNDPYEVEKVDGKMQIKIGDAEKFVSKGFKTYTISYLYDMGTDPYKGFDEFIFHCFGDFWGTDIHNASVTLQMPKEIDSNSINFFADKYRKENINDKVNYEIDGKVLNAYFNELNNNGHALTKSLTVDIDLPEGYFTKGSWNYGFGSFLIFLFILAITIYIIYSWVKFGKDFRKRHQTVEFYAPGKLSSAEIGYLYNKGQPTKKLVISLIISLASKGFIKIDELPSKKKKDTKMQITNLHPNADEETKKALNHLEDVVYKRLFKEKDVVILSEHETFYKAFDDVYKYLNKSFKNQLIDKKSQKKFDESIGLILLCFTLPLVSFYVVEDLDPRFSIIYYLSFALIVIMYVFTIIMKRKTNYGEVITAKVAGFRNFLDRAEKDELESMVEKDPKYFYNILPFTYVLGLSKKWIKKFENIKIPKADMGNFDYLNDASYYHLFDNVTLPVSASSSSGGGCSSCGGGCSSCGGGGSW